MPPTVASSSLSDDVFLAAFHACELPPSEFRHGDHLRFAWLTLQRHGLAESLVRVREGIQRFARHHGAEHIFHETITAAWVHLLASHAEPDFGTFLATNAKRLNGVLLYRFWSPEVLAGSAAKQRWVPPDRAMLPVSVRA